MLSECWTAASAAYVYLAIMYSIYGGVAEYPVTIDLAVDCCARMIYII